jgi:hypothetical protein
VFENWVLRGVFVLKRDEVTGQWRKVHNEELNELYCSTNMRWTGQLERMRERSIQGFGGKTCRKETTWTTQG